MNTHAADLEDLQIQILVKYFEISAYAYELFYSTDNESTIYSVQDFFPELLHRKATPTLLFSYCRNWDVLLHSLDLVSASCSYGISKSICKTALINTSHTIRKHEHTFGIPARLDLAISGENRQRILLNIVLHIYPIFWVYDKYIQKLSSVTMQINFFSAVLISSISQV